MGAKDYCYRAGLASREVNSIRVRCIETGKVYASVGEWKKAVGGTTVKVFVYGMPANDGLHYERMEK